MGSYSYGIHPSKNTKAGTLALKYDCEDTDIELLNELTTTKPEALDAVKMPTKEYCRFQHPSTTSSSIVTSTVRSQRSQTVTQTAG